MISNTKLLLIIDNIKKDCVDKNCIKNVIDEYQIYPQYIIKYITVYHSQISAECIVKHIINIKNKRCELMDCVLNSYNIKMCEIPALNNLVCIGECRCYSRDIWINMYKIIIDVLKKDPNLFLTSSNMYRSLTTLVSKTDVMDSSLFDIVKILSKNPKNWKIVITFIKDVELYSTNYGDIVFTIRDLILANDKLDNTKKNKNISEFANRALLGTTLRRYNEMQKSMTKINDKLYLSDISIAKNVAIIREKNIQNIITITKKSIFTVSGIEYTHIMIDDVGTVNFIENTLTIVLKTIEQLKENKVTLVHCYKGLSRSVCFVLLLLIHQGMTFDEAYARIHKKKQTIDPNPEFIRQIMHYYDNVYPKNILC